MSDPKDNSHLAQKLEIRRAILKRGKFAELRVLDLCSGEGVIWKELRREFKVKAYTPCDRSPRLAGSLKMEMTDRTLNAFDLAKLNVIDVDPYGDPWTAWMNLSPRIKHRTAVFLTHGQIQTRAGASQVSRALRTSNGIPEDWDVPHSADFAFLGGSKVCCMATKSDGVAPVLIFSARQGEHINWSSGM